VQIWTELRGLKASSIVASSEEKNKYRPLVETICAWNQVGNLACLYPDVVRVAYVLISQDEALMQVVVDSLQTNANEQGENVKSRANQKSSGQAPVKRKRKTGHSIDGLHPVLALQILQHILEVTSSAVGHVFHIDCLITIAESSLPCEHPGI